MPSSSGNSSLPFKLALISTGVVSFAMILRIYVPAVTGFAVSEVPVMYSSFIAWLRPPYLYLVINGIIISIVASSKIQLQKGDEYFKQPVFIYPPPPSVGAADNFPAEFTDGGFGYHDLNAAATVSKLNEGENEKITNPSKTAPPPLRSDSIEELNEKLEKEKPLVSKRLGQNKSVKPSPEVLGVSKFKRQDTLENTWKKITEGRAIPLSRHLKKSETWDTKSAVAQRAKKMKKSETFSEEKSSRLRKEPSLSQEELNKRVEAFINKFNEEMRLQREESLNQYQQMIARGAC